MMIGKKPTREEDLDQKNRVISFVHGLGALVLSSPHFFAGNAVCGDLNSPD